MAKGAVVFEYCIASIIQFLYLSLRLSMKKVIKTFVICEPICGMELSLAYRDKYGLIFGLPFSIRAPRPFLTSVRKDAGPITQRQLGPGGGAPS